MLFNTILRYHINCCPDNTNFKSLCVLFNMSVELSMLLSITKGAKKRL